MESNKDDSAVSTKEQHLKLAGVVKGVHAKLRKNYKKDSSDYEAIWASHLEDKQLLSEYADAMHHLATEIWTTNQSETRIDWCRKACLEYFFERTGLQKQLEKDKKRQYHAELNLKKKEQGHTEDLKTSTESSKPAPLGSVREVQDVTSGEDERSDSCMEKSNAVNEEHQSPLCSTITPPFSGLIRLLDVGSCYNPFREFEEFDAIGIDISPAVESVYRCDFLHLDVTSPSPSSEPSTTTTTNPITAFLPLSPQDPITQLPCGAFHVVVFSLLLEYLPSPAQRWRCCQRAHDVLSTNGLLLVITPDSHHQNKNAHQMKSWKAGIESLGFRRWRYEKLTHLHCMAFRKVAETDSTGSSLKTGSSLHTSSSLHTGSTLTTGSSLHTGSTLTTGSSLRAGSSPRTGSFPQTHSSSATQDNADMLYIPQDHNDGDNQRDGYCTDSSQPTFQEDDVRKDLEELPDFVDL